MLRGFEIVLSERDRREGGEIDVRAGVDYDKRKQSREQRIESRDPVEPGREGEPRKTHKTFDEVVLNYRARLLNRKTSANCGKKKKFSCECPHESLVSSIKAFPAKSNRRMTMTRRVINGLLLILTKYFDAIDRPILQQPETPP